LPELRRVSAVATIRPPARPLDVTTLGIIRDRLARARSDLHQAALYARGNPEALAMVNAAGLPLRAALETFDQAYRRGRL
jgi:hypothetical protein